jgi:hypothetical protein
MTFPPPPGRDDQPHDSTVESLHAYFPHQPTPPPGQQPFGADQAFPPPGVFPAPGAFPPPGAPPTPPRRGRFAALLVPGAVVLLVLACCGYGIFRSFGGGDDDKPKNTGAAASARPTSSFSYAPSLPPTRSPSPIPTTSPPPPSPTKPSLDDVKEKDCLRNDGTDTDPEMVPVACGKGTYQVLKRLYGTIDPSPCQDVRGYTAHYTVTYYRNGIMQISSSYVFCLKKL